MKILIFGQTGQVGSELVQACSSLGQIYAPDSKMVSFLDETSIVNCIKEYKPTYIINAAAYTAVDKAENLEESAIAMQINGNAVGVIAEEAKKMSAKFIHYSTDYVFDGRKFGPYDESDTPSPLNSYGRSKLKGEEFIAQIGGESAILRVSWVYGNSGQNFFKTMLRLGQQRSELKIVSDQVGAPTWSRDIATATAQLARKSVQSKLQGVYHLSPTGKASWYDFAVEIFKNYRQSNCQPDLLVSTVLPISTAEYPLPAVRPKNSQLDSSKIAKDFGIILPSWDESLKAVFKDYASHVKDHR
ncbi:dTDP-4-dehydrorhamnose reductase [Bdellovibrio sp. HCB209]|uniref:dTDP-4-dehydrorhamnose reductase n=1 Tax=Bdellovibrio sp. HCB209 TaxID=3394354 RepID=UPI0039B39771